MVSRHGGNHVGTVFSMMNMCGNVGAAVFPLPITLWWIGDAVWLAVEGEHYNLLQRALRERFAGVPIVVATLANGSRPTYLPTVESYGKGIYQESIALLAPGSLEQVIKAIGEEIQAKMGE